VSRAVTRAAAATAIVGAATLGWALAEARAYTLREYDVPVLPPGHTPIRLLHISDLHLLPSDLRRIEWVKRLERYQPDLVITTGDNLSHPEAVPAVAEAMSPFLGVPGAFVTGSNDYYEPVPKNPFAYFRTRDSIPPPSPTPTLPAAALKDVLTSRGWLDLDNARGRLRAQDSTIDLVGTGDAHIDAAHYPEPQGPSRRADVHLGVTHAPYQRVLQRMRLDGVDLALAGHTHGGQICLPWFGALVTNCDIDRRMARGLHRWPGKPESSQPDEQMWLHVSAGLGTSPFTPIRFACRPEASLLTLTAR